MDTITVSSSFTSIYSTIPPATKSCQLGKNKWYYFSLMCLFIALNKVLFSINERVGHLGGKEVNRNIKHQTTWGIRRLTLDIRLWISDVAPQKSNIRQWTSDITRLASSIRHWTYNIRHQTSEIRHQKWDIIRQTLDIRLLTLDKRNRTSDIGHQMSDFRHAMSDVGLQTSEVWCLMSNVRCLTPDVSCLMFNVRRLMFDGFSPVGFCFSRVRTQCEPASHAKEKAVMREKK